LILRCVECRRESSVGFRWRAYLADDPRDDDPSQVAVFCPSCAEREFGDFGGFGDSFDEPSAYG
jgi:hypothetical protein